MRRVTRGITRYLLEFDLTYKALIGRYIQGDVWGLRIFDKNGDEVVTIQYYNEFYNFATGLDYLIRRFRQPSGRLDWSIKWARTRRKWRM